MFDKVSTLPILALIALSEPLQAIAQTQTPTTPEPPQGYWPGHMMWGAGYPWHWGMGFVVMLLFAIVCMAMMFSMMRGGMMHRHRSEHAIDVLKERFARGEINQAEYEERRRVLET